VTLLTAPAVEVVDTTGAGDTFVGALAAEMARGAGVLEAARLAVVAGSLSVRALGATSGMPDRQSVIAAAQPAG
jgi:ribokinase